jgi:magnesium transporter
MISIYQKTLKQKALKEVPEARPGSWIHASSPTTEELDALSEFQGFDRSVLTDETPRIEIEDNVVFLFTRVPSKNRDMATVPFTIALHPELTLTVATEELPFVNSLAKKDPATTQKIKFVLLLLSEVNRLYLRSITSIRKEVNRIKVRPDQVTDREILSFVELENDLNDYLNALIPMSLMYRRLASGNVVSLYEDDKDLVEDLELGAEQLIEGAKTILRTIVNIREAYSVVATNRLNQVIRVLTTLTVLLTIPTMITSFFGMNVQLPLESNPSAPWIILGGTLALVAAIILFFRHRKWL